MKIQTKPYSVSKMETLRVSRWLVYSRMPVWLPWLIAVGGLAFAYSVEHTLGIILCAAYAAILIYYEILLRRIAVGKIGNRNEMTHETSFDDNMMISKTGQDREARLPLSDFEWVEINQENVLFFLSRLNASFIPLSAFASVEDVDQFVFQLGEAGVRVKDKRKKRHS